MVYAKKIIKILMAILIFLVGLNVAPNYADASILDVCSSCAYPTIQSAADNAVAGDTVNVKAGIYNEQVTVNNSGSAGSPIIFISETDKAAIIDGAGLTIAVNGDGFGSGLFQIIGKSYINVTGFSIKNSGSVGIFVQEGASDPTFINIKNNYIYNTKSSGIIIRGGHDHVIDGNEIQQAANGGSSFRSQEIISLQRVDKFEIKNNKVYDGGNPQDGGEGIDAKWGVSNGKIHHNTVYNVVSTGIYVDAWDTFANNIDIYNNTIHDANRRWGQGIAIGAETGGTVDTIRVYNNLVYNNDYDGFYSPSASAAATIQNITVVNNVFYNNGIGPDAMGGIDIQVWTSGATIKNVSIINNIVYGNKSWQIAVGSSGVSNITIDHNLVYPPRGFVMEVKGTNFIESDPLFINAAGGDFHLQATSPAINAGTSTLAPAMDFEGNARPAGIAYDIGAFEYGGVVPSGTPTPTGIPTSTLTSTPTVTSTTTATPTSTVTSAPTVPPCVPSKTCADYPGQCNLNTYDGCSNSLNCWNACTPPLICSYGACKNPSSQEVVSYPSAIPSVSWPDLFGNVTAWILGIVSSITLLFLMLGGFFYISSGGDEQRMVLAKRIIIASLIGFLIIILSASLTGELMKIL